MKHGGEKVRPKGKVKWYEKGGGKKKGKGKGR